MSTAVVAAQVALLVLANVPLVPDGWRPGLLFGSLFLFGLQIGMIAGRREP